MTWIFWLAMALLFLLASGFYSGSEMGLYCINQLRLRLRANRTREWSAKTLLQLAKRQQEPLR